MGNKREAKQGRKSRKKIVKRLPKVDKFGRKNVSEAPAKTPPKNKADWTRDDHIEFHKHKPALTAQQKLAVYTQEKTRADKCMTRSTGKDDKKGKLFYQARQWENTHRINSATYSTSKSRTKVAVSVTTQTWHQQGQDISTSSDSSSNHKFDCQNNCNDSKKKSYIAQPKDYPTSQKK